MGHFSLLLKGNKTWKKCLMFVYRAYFQKSSYSKNPIWDILFTKDGAFFPFGPGPDSTPPLINILPFSRRRPGAVPLLRHAGCLLRRPHGPDRDQAGHHPRRRGHAEAAQAGGAGRRQGAHLHGKDAHGGRGQGGEGGRGRILGVIFFYFQ